MTNLIIYLALSKVSSVNSLITKCSSITDVQESIRLDNMKHCDFFKYFKYDLSDKIGSVSDPENQSKLIINILLVKTSSSQQDKNLISQVS